VEVVELLGFETEGCWEALERLGLAAREVGSKDRNMRKVVQSTFHCGAGKTAASENNGVQSAT
jgi:hypothetical protein